MFNLLFGNKTMGKVLLFLARYEEGYPQEVALAYFIPISMIQRQMDKLEREGVLVSAMKGNTRVYQWNPRYPFQAELRALLNKAFDFMPKDELVKYYMKRTRPRRKAKPL